MGSQAMGAPSSETPVLPERGRPFVGRRRAGWSASVTGWMSEGLVCCSGTGDGQKAVLVDLLEGDQWEIEGTVRATGGGHLVVERNAGELWRVPAVGGGVATLLDVGVSDESTSGWVMFGHPF